MRDASTDVRRTVLIYIPISGIQVGVPNDFAFYLAAIANGASVFGRISAGFVADRVGAYQADMMSIDSGIDAYGQGRSMS